MIKKLKKILNKKGFLTVEFTVIILIVVTVTAFMIDVTIVGVQRATMSRELQSFVQIVEQQSGIEGSAPSGYSGAIYYTPSTMTSLIEQMREENGLTSLRFLINGTEVTDTVAFKFNHKETFNVRMEYGASWGFVANLLPGFTSNKIYTQEAIGFTEFRDNYDTWGGE